jgi:ATP-dependent Clp protease ATP-binding subunit ClpA
MKLYQIYIPELGTYIKYKALDPDSIESLIEELDEKPPRDFKLAVLENVIYNIKPEIAQSLRMMSREAAERSIDAMFNGCVMLNPGIDIDLWIELAYVKNVENKDNYNKTIQDFSSMESSLAQHLQQKIMDSRSSSTKVKTKKISRQKFLQLQGFLESNIIGQDEAIQSVVSSLRRSHVGLNDKNRPLGVFLFAGPSGVRKNTPCDKTP